MGRPSTPPNEAIDVPNIELLLDVDTHYLSRYPFFHFQWLGRTGWTSYFVDWAPFFERWVSLLDGVVFLGFVPPWILFVSFGLSLRRTSLSTFSFLLFPFVLFSTSLFFIVSTSFFVPSSMFLVPSSLVVQPPYSTLGLVCALPMVCNALASGSVFAF